MATTGADGRISAIPQLGRTGGAMVALPQAQAATPAGAGPSLDYDVAVHAGGAATVTLYLSPTLATTARADLRIGVSIDDGPVQVLEASLDPGAGRTAPARLDWSDAVSDNIVRLSTPASPLGAGKHIVKVWRIDDNIVLQKLVLSTVPVPASYLGPITA